MTERPDERSLRREGEWIDLGCGGRWSLPVPEVVVRPLPELGDRLFPTFNINGRPAPELEDHHRAMREGAEEHALALIARLLSYVLGFNYRDLDAERVGIMLLGAAEGRPLDEYRDAIARVTRVCYTDPVNAAARAVEGLPRVAGDTTDVGVN